jgi:hypothetical protein
MRRLIYIMHGVSFKRIESYEFSGDKDTTCRLKPIEERFIHISRDLVLLPTCTHNKLANKVSLKITKHKIAPLKYMCK